MKTGISWRHGLIRIFLYVMKKRYRHFTYIKYNTNFFVYMKKPCCWHDLIIIIWKNLISILPMYSILHCCFVWVKKPYWWHGPIRILSLCDVTLMYIRITLFFAQSHRNTYEVSPYKKKQHRRITNNFKNRLYLVLYCYSSISILLSQLTLCELWQENTTHSTQEQM